MEEQDQERKQTMARMRDRSGDVPQSDLRESYILEDNEEGVLPQSSFRFSFFLHAFHWIVFGFSHVNCPYVYQFRYRGPVHC